jgi:hypothetical protein
MMNDGQQNYSQNKNNKEINWGEGHICVSSISIVIDTITDRNYKNLFIFYQNNYKKITK